MINRRIRRRDIGLGREHALRQLAKQGLLEVREMPKTDRYSFWRHLNTVFNLNGHGWILMALMQIGILVVAFSAGYLAGSIGGR